MRAFGSGSRARRTRGDGPADAVPRPSRSLLNLGRSARRPLAIATAAPLLAGLLLAPQAWMLAGVMQRALVERTPATLLIPTAGVIAALIATRAALVWIGDVAGQRAAAGVVAGLQQGLFRQLLRQRPDWSAARSSGALAGAIVDQAAALEGFFARYLPAMALAATLPILFAVVALTVDPVVGLLFLLTAPLIPVFMALVGWGAEAAHKQHQQALLRLSGFFADRLRGLVTLKLLGRAEAEALALRETGDDLRRRTLGVLRIAFLSSAVLEFFAALGVAGVALYIGLSYLGFIHLHAKPLTLQAGLFCLFMAPEVYLPLRQFAAHYHDRAAAVAAVEGLRALFETLPEPIALTSATGSRESAKRPAGPLQGRRVTHSLASLMRSGRQRRRLEARMDGLAAELPAPVSNGTPEAVRPSRRPLTRAPQDEGDGRASFTPLPCGALEVLVTDLTVVSPGDARPIFSGAEFAAAPGTRIALVGTSGAGKSTFLETLARLRETGGRIELGGVPLDAIAETELRTRVAILGQRPRLFADTMAVNIRLGDPAASDMAVAAAAERAGLGRLIRQLPDGLATRIGDDGLGLSGGEAHRVALARIFLRDPDLILLDEPTAHLDPEMEAAVLDGILDFAGGRTLIVATHSAAVTARMDRVLRIEAGRIFATPHRRAAQHLPRKGAA